MKIIRSALPASALGLAILLLAGGQALSDTPAVVQNPAVPQGVEPLAYGPVHEAFAEVVPYNPQPGLTVSAPPPAPVEELPPDQRPAGDNVVWVPGYWGWDDVRENYVWISGTWRDVPPGRHWVPGYWAQVKDGWQWSSGYWADPAQQEVAYLPPPPDSLEAGPSTPAPGENYVWTPGVWMWRETRFAWRPGSWLQANPDWLWVPAHYVRTPGGCLFVDGYWDRPLARRGLLFAPVFFEPTVLSRPRFAYRPNVVVNASLLVNYLFVQPRYYHYCFGDYYAADYLQVGIYPWFAFHLSHFGYEPIFAQARWTHLRTDPRWETNIRRQYVALRQNQASRPPRTFAAVQARERTGPSGVEVRNAALVQPLARVTAAAAARQMPFRMVQVNAAQRTQITRRVQEVRRTTMERGQVEKKVATQGLLRVPGREARPVQVAAPRAVIASRPVQELHKDFVPPARPRVVQAPVVKTPARPAAHPRPDETLRKMQEFHGVTTVRPAVRPEIRRPREGVRKEELQREPPRR